MKTTIIGIAGGTASGKSLVSKKVFEESSLYGSVVVIKMDDYYKDLSNLSLEERAQINYDHPNSFDIDLLVDHINKLKNGESINKPIYDFVTQTRLKETEYVEPKPVIILEGILVLEDERIRDLASIKVFVNCDDDLRFIRRLKRDTEERGRSVESIINQYMNTVRPMYHLFVRPTIRYADIIIPNDRQHTIGTQLLIRNIKALISENN